MKIFGNWILIGLVAWFTSCTFLVRTANALNLGVNITVFDGSNDDSSSNSWYNGTNEDQEVEPNCVADQKWDLEGFFLDGSELQVVGGFDFLNGYENYSMGDIFLDVTGNYDQNGDNSKIYDYVLDLDIANNSYDVWKIDSSAVLTSVYYSQNSHSNPWLYEGGGSFVESGTLYYYENLSDTDVGGLYGGTHYALTGLDLGFIAGKYFTVHTTMECGNDNLIGQGTAPVPEPATLILMGTGLVCIAGFSRRKIKKQA